MSTKDANDVKPTSSKSNEISLSGTATPKKTSSVPAKEDRKDTTKKDIANERTSSSKSKDDSEKYVELKNKLIQQILKKQELTRKLTTLENSIYQKEIDYFEESPLGNIVKGFENFSKTGGGGGANKRKIVYSEDDHIFSLSSVNYIKSLMKRQGHTSNGGSSKDDFDDYEDSVDPTTASAGSKANSIEKNETPSGSSGTPSRKRKARVLED